MFWLGLPVWIGKYPASDREREKIVAPDPGDGGRRFSAASLNVEASALAPGNRV
jgi:hypothetical protein